jgi:hypothetical protein
MMFPPAVAWVLGHDTVTAIVGAVVTAHVAVTALVAGFNVQMSRPLPLNTVATEQALAGTATLLVKATVAPGAMVAAENTMVFAAGRSLTTTTLVKVLLPVLRTVPL